MLAQDPRPMEEKQVGAAKGQFGGCCLRQVGAATSGWVVPKASAVHELRVLAGTAAE